MLSGPLRLRQETPFPQAHDELEHVSIVKATVVTKGAEEPILPGPPSSCTLAPSPAAIHHFEGQGAPSGVLGFGAHATWGPPAHIPLAAAGPQSRQERAESPVTFT